jgi:hypothetical protein
VNSVTADSDVMMLGTRNECLSGVDWIGDLDRRSITKDKGHEKYDAENTDWSQHSKPTFQMSSVSILLIR